MKKALYAGSFDPVTLGHLDIIERGSKIFDEVVIAVTEESLKKSFLYPLSIRIKMLELATAHLPSVKVIPMMGLAIDSAKQEGATVLLRGLRSFHTEFEYEFQMAACNLQLSGIETVFLPATPVYSHISSTLVKEIIKGKGNVQGFIPKALENEFKDLFIK